MQHEAVRLRQEREQAYLTGSIRKTVSDTRERYKEEPEDLLHLQLMRKHELEELYGPDKEQAQRTG